MFHNVKVFSDNYEIMEGRRVLISECKHMGHVLLRQHKHYVTNVGITNLLFVCLCCL